MKIGRMLTELVHGKVHYSSGDAVRWVNPVGVASPLEVRVQGKKPLIYYRSSAGEGWTPLTPSMARSFASALGEAANVASTLESSRAATKDQ